MIVYDFKAMRIPAAYYKKHVWRPLDATVPTYKQWLESHGGVMIVGRTGIEVHFADDRDAALFILKYSSQIL
jgi:hypothetical protein